MKNDLYEKDFYSWTIEQTKLLESKQFNRLDLENLIEEITDLGSNKKDSLTSHLKNILLHLLKWKYQPERKSRSWFLSISNSRDSVNDLLEDNPGLSNKLNECFLKAYIKAKKKAARETGLPINIFPTDSPWTLELVLDEDFWPEEINNEE